jgi:hypothetical protein
VRSASISLGKLFGVQIRMHALLLAALALAIVWAHFVGAEPLRGLLLWLALLLAVAVGEIARALTGAYCGFTLRRVLLLPAGGGSTFVTPPNSRTPRALLLAAPLANMAFGLVIAGIIVTLAPQVVLLDPHWVTPLHLLRSLVWLNLVLGVVNLLPSSAQDRAAFGISAQSAERTPGAPPAILASGVPLAAIVAGMVFLNWWIVFGGLGLLLVAQFLREQPTPGGKAAQPIRVRDVMLTDFAVLSASATPCRRSFPSCAAIPWLGRSRASRLRLRLPPAARVICRALWCVPSPQRCQTMRCRTRSTAWQPNPVRRPCLCLCLNLAATPTIVPGSSAS